MMTVLEYFFYTYIIVNVKLEKKGMSHYEVFPDITGLFRIDLIKTDNQINKTQ